MTRLGIAFHHRTLLLLAMLGGGLVSCRETGLKSEVGGKSEVGSRKSEVQSKSEGGEAKSEEGKAQPPAAAPSPAPDAQPPPPAEPSPPVTDQSAREPAPVDPGSPPAPSPPAARRRPPADSTRDCLSAGCHEKLQETPFVHGPLLVGACDTCHQPVGEKEEHRFKLSRPKQTLCTSCHRTPAAQKVVHKPYAESGCLDCHDPHGGRTKSLIVPESVARLCEKCHQPPQAKVLHGPVAMGECLVCHRAHQSEEDKLVTLPGKDLCVKCHVEVGNLLATAAYVHGPAAVDCGACHAPHGAGDKLLLRRDQRSLCAGCHDSVAEQIAADAHVHGAVTGEKGCLSCHTPHASQLKSQLRGQPGEVCISCHDRELVNPRTKKKVANVAQEVLTAQFKHGPVKTGDCQGCHHPHSSPHEQLLIEKYPREFYQDFSESGYGLCFRCHEKTLVVDERTTTLTRFRNGDQNLHFLHVNRAKGRTCRACHEVHASNLPSHLRKSVPFGSAGWMLPINYRKTETGGACSPGCHKPLSYDNSGRGPPAPAEPPAASKREPPGGG